MSAEPDPRGSLRRPHRRRIPGATPASRSSAIWARSERADTSTTASGTWTGPARVPHFPAMKTAIHGTSGTRVDFGNTGHTRAATEPDHHQRGHRISRHQWPDLSHAKDGPRARGNRGKHLSLHHHRMARHRHGRERQSRREPDIRPVLRARLQPGRPYRSNLCS